MKKALLVVSFGTTYEATRRKTIEVCEKRLREAYPDYTFFRAYTSGMIIQKLATRDGLFIDTPEEALQRIQDAGYEVVHIQALHIICGQEYQKLEKVVTCFKAVFTKLTLGKPLLHTLGDYEKTIATLQQTLPSLGPHEAQVWMGHGTTHESFPAYCALEHLMRARGIKGYVGTVEGYPTFEAVCDRLEADQIHTVYLMPFMLVVGDHALNDLVGEAPDTWKMQLEKRQIEVRLILKGLGEYEGIQSLFVEHSRVVVG